VSFKQFFQLYSLFRHSCIQQGDRCLENLKVTFATWSLFDSCTSWNTACINYDVYTWIRKPIWLVVFTLLLKLKVISRSQAVM